MAKKILILETSETMQKLFTASLDSKEFKIKFEDDAKNFFYTFLDFKPEIFLVNCDITNPGSYEIVKFLRSIREVKELKIGMYSNIPSPLHEAMALESGADSFIVINAESISEKINQLLALESKSLYSYNNAMLSKIISLTGLMENFEEMIHSFLLLLAQVCEVPLLALYLLENDGPHAYYVCAPSIDTKDVSDFLKVAAGDFEKNLSNTTAKKIKAKNLKADEIIENFYSSGVKLSSYECKLLKNIGTIHIVSQGNIISEKLEYLDFCIENAYDIFEKALVLKKKLFFEKRIRRAFSRFVPEQIIDSLVMQVDDTDQKVGVGETRSVAILFSDIRSFTNISEKNRADVLVAFLNRYFSTMVEIIKKHGGTIDKFIGDAIMAEFGTPVSYEDNCRRAVMAAYEMRDALPTIEMGDLVMPDGMVFNIGIGIHYGDVIVGSIGSKDKTDYSVIGDNVNLASRLEGLTKTYGTQILVSESVRTDAGEDSFFFRHLDDVRVKGKKNAVPIYAVDRSENEFSSEYKNAYIKGMELYKQGIWNLAKDYFSKALNAEEGDKAAKLMLDRCEEFIKNPPENWDGAIAFMTK